MTRSAYTRQIARTDTLKTDAEQLAAIQALLGIGGSGSVTLTGDITGSGASPIATTLKDVDSFTHKAVPIGADFVLIGDSAASGAPKYATVTELAAAIGGGGMAIGGTITSATAGSVLFAGAAGVLAQDNNGFYYDSANSRLILGGGGVAPQTKLEVVGDQNTFIMRTTDAAGYSSFRCYNSANSSARAMELGYTGASGNHGLPALVNGQTAEGAYLTTTGAYPFEFGTANTLRMTLGATGLLMAAGHVVASPYRVGAGTTTPQVPLEVVSTGAMAYFRNTSSTSTCLIALLNDQNTNARALAFEYTGSAYGFTRVTDGPTGEQGLVHSRGAYPLVLATNDTMRMVLGSAGSITLQATNTAAGTTGAQAISKASGKVNFAAAATSLVVTNTLCTTASIVWPTMLTNDTTARNVWAVPAAGSFTIYMDPAPTAEVAVGFLVLN